MSNGLDVSGRAATDVAIRPAAEPPRSTVVALRCADRSETRDAVPGGTPGTAQPASAAPTYRRSLFRR